MSCDVVAIPNRRWMFQVHERVTSVCSYGATRHPFRVPVTRYYEHAFLIYIETQHFQILSHLTMYLLLTVHAVLRQLSLLFTNNPCKINHFRYRQSFMSQWRLFSVVFFFIILLRLSSKFLINKTYFSLSQNIFITLSVCQLSYFKRHRMWNVAFSGL